MPFLSVEPGLFFLIFALLLTGLLSFLMAAIAWKYRHAKAAVTFSALSMAAGIHSLGYFFELNSTTMEGIFFWLRFQYLGISILPALWFLFILQYTDRHKWLKNPLLAGLFFIPAMTLVLVMTSEFHHLFYRELSLKPLESIFIVSIQQGPWYWVHMSYFYFLYILSCLFLLEEYLQSSIFFKRRFLIILIGSLFPAAAATLYITGVVPIPLDLVPFGIFLAALVFLWDLIYFKPFEILPVARSNVFNAMEAGLVVLDTRNQIIDINESARKLFGSLDSLVGRQVETIIDIFSGPGERFLLDRQKPLEWFADTPQGGKWFEIRCSAIASHPRKVRARLLILQDITRRKEAEAALLESESLKSSIVEAIPDTLVRFSWEGICLDILGEKEDAFLLREEVEGKSLWAFWPQTLASCFMEAIHGALKFKALQTLEFSLKKTGGLKHYEARVKAFANNEVVAIIRDITESKQYQEKLEHLSLHDQLTGLYNRAFFEEEMARLSRSRDYPITIIAADVDGLKQANDTLGHDQGDHLLKQAARVVKKTLRRGDIFARIGGDEFAAILPRTDVHAGREAVNRIKAEIDAYNKKEPGLPLEVSIGMATAINEGESLEKCFKEADNAMYRDKQQRKNHQSREA